MTEIRMHPVREPLPSGWRLAQDLQALHHNRHSVLIERVPTRRGRSVLLSAMPVGWHTARALAKIMGRTRNGTGVLLLRALRAGLVERRPSECPHCGERMFEWRRR